MFGEFLQMEGAIDIAKGDTRDGVEDLFLGSMLGGNLFGGNSNNNNASGFSNPVMMGLEFEALSNNNNNNANLGFEMIEIGMLQQQQQYQTQQQQKQYQMQQQKQYQMQQQQQQYQMQQQQLEAERQRQYALEVQRETEQKLLQHQQEEQARAQAYDGHMSSGYYHQTFFQYSKAIDDYNAALQIRPNDLKARFDIACCTEYKKEYAQAFALFTQLNAHMSEMPDINTHLDNCATAMSRIGVTHFKNAKKLYQDGSKVESQQEMLLARSCINSSRTGTQLELDLNDFANKMHWDEIRDDIDTDFATAVAKFKQRSFRDALQRFEQCKILYKEYAAYLSDVENANMQSLEDLLSQTRREVQRLDNRDFQLQINSKKATIQDSVSTYDIAAAVKHLQEIISLCQKINPPADVADMEGYIPLATLEGSMQLVLKFQKEFEARKKTVTAKVAQAVFTQDLNSKMLVTNELNNLQKMIQTILTSDWKDLDRRNLEALTAGLRNIVQAHLVKHHCVVVCYYGASYYVRDFDSLRNALIDHVNKNLPSDYREPLSLPMFEQLPQATNNPPLTFMQFSGSRGSESTVPYAQVVTPEELHNIEHQTKKYTV